MATVITQYAHGVTGNVQFDSLAGSGPGQGVAAKNWSGDFNSEMDETSNFQSGGWKEFAAGLKDCSGTIEVVAKTTDQIWTVTPALTNGTVVVLTLTATTGIVFSGPAWIQTVGTKVDVKGAVMYSCKYQSHGPWTMPDEA